MNVTPGCMAAMPYGYQTSLKGPYVAAEVIISLLAIVGNFLVCLAVTCNHRLRTVTNYFLVSLSVADILVGLLAIPCAVLTDLGRPHHNLPLCVLLLSILMVLTQSSILSMLAVAAERYVAILHPFQYQRVMSPRNARLALLLTWVLALLSGSVPLMDWHKQSPNSDFCIFTCIVDMTILVYFNFFVCLLVPLATMVFIYGHIFLTVRQQLKRIAVARGSAPQTEGTGDPVGSGASRGAAAEGIHVGTGKANGGDAEETQSSVVSLKRRGKLVEDGGCVGAQAGEDTWTGALDLTREQAAAPQAGPAAVPEASSTTEDGLDTTKRAPIVFTLKSAFGLGCSGSSGSSCGSSGSSCGSVNYTSPTARTRKELRKATSLFLVLFQFMVCWMPVHCINCVLLLSPQTHVPMSVTLAAILLSHANSALNPLLYAYRMRSFRYALKGMCVCWSRYC